MHKKKTTGKTVVQLWFPGETALANLRAGLGNPVVQYY